MVNTLTPEHCTALRRRLCPKPKPQAVFELCPCCGNSDGSYWVFPSYWSSAETLLWWGDYGPKQPITPARRIDQWT